MVINIKEKRPTGKGSFEEAIKQIQRTDKSASDMRDVWPGIISELRDAETYAFSSSNPSRWDKLSDKYRQWKIKKGYPATIGIKTGALKLAMTKDAQTKIQKLRFSYGINTGSQSMDYAHYFSNKRPVLDYARTYINQIKNQAIKDAIMKKIVDTQ